MGQEQSQNVEQTGNSENGNSERAKQRAPLVRQKAKLEDIIVVKDTPDAGEAAFDETSRKLKKLKITYPFIKNVTGVPVETQDILPGLNADPMTEMMLRYQFHLTECAEAVAFDQNAIGKRVKEIELYSSSVLKEAHERQKQMAYFLSNMKMFTEIDSLMDRINKNMDKTVKLMQNINQILPEHEQFSCDELDVRNPKNIIP